MTRAVERVAQQWAKSGPRDPLEVMHAIVETAADRLEPAARGKYVFPFNQIHVVAVARTPDEQARLAAVFESEPTLQGRIAGRLHQAGCPRTELDVTIDYVTQPAADWMVPEFHVEFARAIPASSPAPIPVQRERRDLKITVVRGVTEKPSYVFTLPRVNLGRCAEVRDSRNRLIRTNHVAFVDSSETANNSVSRRHAHIEYVEDVRQYRIRDDRSAQGTSIVRNGRTVLVPAGSRGIRLHSGDEIVLGEARARVRIDEGS